jgi:hypothetical protein
MLAAATAALVLTAADSGDRFRVRRGAVVEVRRVPRRAATRRALAALRARLPAAAVAAIRSAEAAERRARY